jgi:DNA polymerase
MPTRPAGDRARRVAAQRLKSLKEAGVTHLGKSRRGSSKVAPEPLPATESAPRTPTKAAPSRAVASKTEPAAAAARRSPAERERALAVIAREVAGCTKCDELAARRTQTVFGVGNPAPRLCFLGEAPGADEDRQGEPFVGRAGQLLTRIIEACGMRREDVYILNVLKCRPPDNRTPLPHEVHNCRPYLDRQLAILEPEYICCVGSVAAQTLLETDVTIGKLRGKLHEYRGIPVVCTYHPAYLLRNPAAKKDTWEDMKMLLRHMGLEPPRPATA